MSRTPAATSTEPTTEAGLRHSFYTTLAGEMDRVGETPTPAPVQIVLHNGVQVAGWVTGLTGNLAVHVSETYLACTPAWEIDLAAIAAIRHGGDQPEPAA